MDEFIKIKYYDEYGREFGTGYIHSTSASNKDIEEHEKQSKNTHKKCSCNCQSHQNTNTKTGGKLTLLRTANIVDALRYLHEGCIISKNNLITYIYKAENVKIPVMSKIIKVHSIYIEIDSKSGDKSAQAISFVELVASDAEKGYPEHWSIWKI